MAPARAYSHSLINYGKHVPDHPAMSWRLGSALGSALGAGYGLYKSRGHLF